MDNKNFDSQLKSALENLEVPLEPTAWSAFEQRFPAPAAPPADAVDQAVRRSLEQLETPYQPAHWDLLAGQLVRIEQLRRRIGVSKVAEAAILLLLLLLANAYGFFGFQNRRAAPAAAPVPEGPVAEAGKTRTGRHTPSPEDAGGANGFFVPLNPSQRPEHESLNGSAIVSENPADPQSSMPDIAIVTTRGQADARFLLLPFGPLSTVDFLTLPTRDLLSPLREITPKAPMASHFYLATYASLEQNHILIGADAQQTNGYGGGLAVGYRPGAWGVEAGIAFSQKNYTPKKQVEIYAGNLNQGYYGTYADRVDADLVSVPVKVTRRVARFGKTGVHAEAGVTAHVAIDKSYRYKKIYYPGSQPSGQPTNQQPALRENSEGVFEGGKFTDNAYATADLGLRVERSMGKRFVAYIEPVCQFNVGGQGIGPKPARIGTVGIHAGVMASL